MKPTPTTLRTAAESYARQIVQAGAADSIEGLVRGYPEGPISVLLCPDCLPAVQRAIEAAVARRT